MENNIKMAAMSFDVLCKSEYMAGVATGSLAPVAIGFRTNYL
jgi:hypothetical protein